MTKTCWIHQYTRLVFTHRYSHWLPFSLRKKKRMQEACVKHKTIAVGFHLQQLAPGGPSLQNPPSQIALKKCIQLFKVQRKNFFITSLECWIYGARQGAFQTVQSFILAGSKENIVKRVASHSTAGIFLIHIWAFIKMFWHFKVSGLDLLRSSAFRWDWQIIYRGWMTCVGSALVFKRLLSSSNEASL